MKDRYAAQNMCYNIKGRAKSLKAASMCCLLALSSPCTMQAQNDSVPHLQKSALEYMLQRPNVTKHYEHKRLGDHLFTELGAGLNVTGTHNFKFGAQANGAIGDFITPEHGLRLGVNAGVYRMGENDVKFGNFTLDYLMNLTAIAHTRYPQPRPFELYGVAGVDVTYARNRGVSKTGWGAHLGLRGQYAFSPYTYIYVEPRLGVLHKNATLSDTWRNFRPTASIMAGVGYRLLTPEERAHKYGKDNSPQNKKFKNGLFVDLMGGPTFLSNAHPSTWKHNAGVRAALSVGRWMNDYNALRLTGYASTIKQDNNPKATALGGQLDYMLNLHNLFGGVDETRRWWVNGVAGVSFSYASSNNKNHGIWGLGGGLQANVRVAKELSLIAEPRVDLYNKNFVNSDNSIGSLDCVPSLLVGIAYTYNSDYHQAVCFNDDFVAGQWHDHIFIETAGGLNVNVTRTAVRHAFKYMRPQAYVGIVRWFSPLHGARLWGQIGKTRYSEDGSCDNLSVGADYLFNFTNAFTGYRKDRLFEFTGGLGFNLARRQHDSKTFVGVDASLRGSWNVSPLCAIYVEPKLQAYGKNYLPSALGSSKMDFIASGMLGVQFNLGNYNAQLGRDLANGDNNYKRSSFAVAGGFNVPANNVRSKSAYNGVGRLSYTHWFSPLSAWRANVQGSLGKRNNYKYGTAVVGADYVTDLTAHAYGYDPSRVVSIMALAGINLGADYSNGKSYFTSDVHFGGQLAVKVGNNAHVFAEPQLSYHLSKRFKDESKLNKWKPLLLVGVDYSFKRCDQLKDIAAPNKKRYVSLNMGTGVNSINLTPTNSSYRWTYNAALGYGQWLTSLHGFEVDLCNMLYKKSSTVRNNLTALRANYMMNLRTAVTGESSDDKLFQLSALAGVSLNVSSGKEMKAKVIPGVQAALQAGWKVSPTIELYLQPEAALYSNKIISNGSGHPIDGQVTLSMGCKYHF